MIQQIIFGFLITLLAILQIFSWIAIGSFFFGFLRIDNRFLGIGFSILIGSAITATLYFIHQSYKKTALLGRLFRAAPRVEHLLTSGGKLELGILVSIIHNICY